MSGQQQHPTFTEEPLPAARILRYVGHSLVITVPPEFAEYLSWDIGDVIVMECVEDELVMRKG